MKRRFVLIVGVAYCDHLAVHEVSVERVHGIAALPVPAIQINPIVAKRSYPPQWARS